MKARLEVLLAQELALNQFGQPWTTLKEIDQNQLRTNVHKSIKNKYSPREASEPLDRYFSFVILKTS